MGTSHREMNFTEILLPLLQSNSSREFGDILQSQLKKLFSFDAAGLYLFTPALETLTLLSGFHSDPTQLAFHISQLPAQGTIKLEAAKSGKTLLCKDVLSSPWTEGKLLRRHFSAVSLLVAPLRMSQNSEDPSTERTLAVMFMASMAPEAFSEKQRKVCERLASCIAPILQKVLAGEERDTLRVINNRLVLGRVSLEGLIPAIQDILKRVIPHDMTCLVKFTLEHNKPWFQILHQDGGHIDLSALHRYPLEDMAPTAMQRTGHPVLITGHQQQPFPEMAYFESIGIFSGMLLPLYVSNRLFGFLALGSRRRNAFSEYDLGVAEQVGLHLSQAISNILAYEEIHSLKDQLLLENTYLREEFTAPLDLKELVGKSRSLQQTLKAVEQVAPTESTVLITGETGTGKELVAQAIHRLSQRNDRPLFKLNCAALTPTLIESELFGHEKGAFTGATERKIGRFEVADKGTLFLDEVGEIPLELQAKLLRVLEHQEIERLGGQKTLRLDVRVLAATNQDLEKAVNTGRFRSDLYYRLKVFPISVSPLRDRREDIPMLVHHFLKKYSGQYRKDLSKVHPEAMRALTEYSWPGNIRELRHVIERAAILSQGSVLIPEFLEPQISRPTDSKPAQTGTTLADQERAYILDMLRRTNWVLAGPKGAATRLGVKRSTLQHRMKKLGITRPSPSP